MARDKSAAPGVGGLEFEMPILEIERKIEELEAFAESTQLDLRHQITQLRQQSEYLRRDMATRLTSWQRVLLARHPLRPVTSDYIRHSFSDFVELHGDRSWGDDHALVTGFARIDGIRVMLVGHRKGKATKDRIDCNFGSAHPEGYRKALQKMKLAEKYGLPVVTLIDTPGAFPGVGAEQRGQAFIIARNLLEMARLRVPVVCVVIGEGGSGGALGIGVGDCTLMLENAYYSVISPEGCSSILWKTPDQACQAAEVLKLTARDLSRFGIVDEIVKEPGGGAHCDVVQATEFLKQAVVSNLRDLMAMSVEHRMEKRYQRLRAIGVFGEGAGEPDVAAVDLEPSPSAASRAT